MFWKTALLLSATLLAACLPKVATAQTASALPMRLNFAEGEMLLTVPDTNTTAAANGRLRVYDEHIAKMFEVTHAWCQQQQVSSGVTWHYYAGDDEIDMGSFYVSCRLAWEVATAYGLGQPETTLVTRFGGEGYPSQTEQWSIPTLNIVGGKVDRWLDFVQDFQPIQAIVS